MFPSGAVLSPVTVTFCPSLNIGSEEVATGATAFAAVWGGGTTAGDTGVTAVGERGAAGASLLGVTAACGGASTGAGGATGAGATGFGFMATGGGVLSPRYGLSHSATMSGSIERYAMPPTSARTSTQRIGLPPPISSEGSLAPLYSWHSFDRVLLR